MNSARWERVQALVEGALALPQAERNDYLQDSESDEDVRAEALSLLSATAVESPPSRWLGVLSAPDVDRFAPGERVADRYRIERLLGRGGMGEVYEAFDEELGITVALKTLREVESGAAERLKLEGMLARSVWHPNVCRVYELGRHDETLWFLTMERLEGRTLADRLGSGGRPSRAEALRIVEDIAGGLGAAHRAGVVHRDLKPANVMLVVRDGVEHAVVTDFGISRAPGARDGAVVMGTPEYMAPEQRRGEEVGPAADIYALGRVLRELLPDEDSVIARCFEEDPRKRFARAEDVADALLGRAPAAIELVSAWPAERDPFVGRASDLADLERALGESRVVTLVGPGGMGKTRLAIRFGARAPWPGGSWFCDLTEAKTADGIASAVGGALSVQLGRGDAVGQLGHAIAGRGRCLLVLDNFEQLVRHAAETVGRWRQLAPEATFLVTSRVRLQLEEERAIAIEPLSLEEGTELFSLRAHGLRPGLEFADETARDIVRHLDGIPLAIELAAARTRVMSVGQIAENVRKRFQLLAGGSGARHETLLGTIDESFELLTPWERAAWAQCAVFEGGCTLDAALAVLDVAAWPEAPPIVDILRSLVDQSLLRTFVPAGAAAVDARFGMYVTLQEYARLKLVDAEPAETRHGRHYAGSGREAVIAALDRSDGPARRRRAVRELDNLIAAFRRAVKRGDGSVAAPALRAAWAILRMRGPLETAIALGREGLAEPRLTGLSRANVLFVLGEAEQLSGRYEAAREHSWEAIHIAREQGDVRLETLAAGVLGRAAFALSSYDEAETMLKETLSHADRSASCAALNAYGMMHHELGNKEEARRLYEEALAVAREIDDRNQEAIVMTSFGILEHKHGNLDQAIAFFERALATHLAAGNRRSEGVIHINLGSVYADSGQWAPAIDHVESAIRIAHELGSRTNQATALTILGELHTDLGRLDEARSSLEAALVLHEEIGDRKHFGVNMASLARVDWLKGKYDEALDGFQRALAILQETGYRYYESGCFTFLALIRLDLKEYAEARRNVDAAEAIARDLNARHELARILSVRAMIEHECGNADAARAAMQEAEKCAEGITLPPDSEIGRSLARAREMLGTAAK